MCHWVLYYSSPSTFCTFYFNISQVYFPWLKIVSILNCATVLQSFRPNLWSLLFLWDYHFDSVFCLWLVLCFFIDHGMFVIIIWWIFFLSIDFVPPISWLPYHVMIFPVSILQVLLFRLVIILVVFYIQFVYSILLYGSSLLEYQVQWLESGFPRYCIVRQMLSRRTKNWLYFINI